ncbi:hypothetical protein GCM10011507_15120 [Edaphobacter acidisoli]|uniref:Adenylate cyclase n=1 Tax=Edaphobacter acidisoli TaxID=2040573 RepID=A0A916RSH6_9BACT|nr:hypothetical protein [Edaphobacter acidisoli]GGA64481.1 hypothetical protein GCM10011507_15120 [Edaphobacter acidisoli]
MSSEIPSADVGTSTGEIDRALIEQQLERMLANRHFSHSRRFPAFLRFVVNKALAGELDELKERTLGVEIFGRKADYDTASDPIVRVTAAEIRKRIAQYYQEPGHEAELRISLDAGSYVPQFHWPKDAHEAHGDASAALNGEGVRAVERVHGARRFLLWFGVPVAAVAALVVLGFVLGWRTEHPSPVDFFWGPVMNAGNPALVCIVDQAQTTNVAVDAQNPDHQIEVPTQMRDVNSDDLSAIVKVGGLFRAYGKEYAMKGTEDTSLGDLRNAPTIFIGAFDNVWTMRFTKPLRFHFGNNPSFDKEWIVDGQTGKQYFTDRPVLETNNDYREYAIVARFTDVDTGQIEVIVAGIGQGSTLIAGDFLTNSTYLAELERDARAAGNKQNIEAVLSTQIINGQPGTPKIEATYFW